MRSVERGGFDGLLLCVLLRNNLRMVCGARNRGWREEGMAFGLLKNMDKPTTRVISSIDHPIYIYLCGGEANGC